MVRSAVHRMPGSTPRRRLTTTMAVLAATVLLVLSSCGALTDALSGSPRDDQGSGDRVVGWSLFHAAADQWQVAFALTKRGAPWMHRISLVEQLRPGAKAPLYEGRLPVNTIIAPAAPTDVGVGGEYGWRTAPDLGIEELHNGADIAAAEGSRVMAAMEGVVRAVFWDVWGGNRVEVAHAGDLVSTYNHLETVLVERGDKLEASQQLGTVGQTGSRVTGPHLHFETWIDDEAVDPQSFDWIVGDRIIPAPHDHARNPQRISRGGPGDESSIDRSKACPYENSDPKRCRPPDVVVMTSDDGSTPWPVLSSAACVSTAPGIFDCEPFAPAPPGPEDCPAAPVEGARTDCPTTPPDLDDPLQCRTADQQSYDCVPFAPAVGLVPGAEDCPTVQAPEARTDCPTLLPDLNSDACVSTAPGILDCMPFDPAPPGPEDCPPAPIEGARTDCPAAPPTLTDPLQCQTVDQLTYDCVPFDPASPGAEDCPPVQVEGARTDCPAAPIGPPEPSASSPAPPDDDAVVPSLGTEAPLLERRHEGRPGARSGRRPRGPSAVTTSERRADR